MSDPRAVGLGTSRLPQPLQEPPKPKRSGYRPSGVRGVLVSGDKFYAQMRIAHQCVYLGMFATREEASAAYEHAIQVAHAAVMAIRKSKRAP